MLAHLGSQVVINLVGQCFWANQGDNLRNKHFSGSSHKIGLTYHGISYLKFYCKTIQGETHGILIKYKNTAKLRIITGKQALLKAYYLKEKEIYLNKYQFIKVI